MTLQLTAATAVKKTFDGVQCLHYFEVPYGPYTQHSYNKGSQIFNLAVPISDKPVPVILTFPGGGFMKVGGRGGFKTHFIKQGYAVAACSYRLSCFDPNGNMYPEKHPVPMHDVARCVQFIRHHAKKLNIDANKIAVRGDSAGGCAAVWVATHDDLADPDNADPVLRQSSRVSCMIGTITQTTLVPKEWETLIGTKRRNKHWVVGIRPNDNPESAASTAKFVEASALHHLSVDDPPIFLTYRNYDEVIEGGNEKDRVHSARHGIVFKKRADELGVTCYVGQMGKTSDEALDKFLKQHL